MTYGNRTNHTTEFTPISESFNESGESRSPVVRKERQITFNQLFAINMHLKF